ncbi:unnamed protein product, partial [Prorocentrum cordatum]
EVQVLKSQLAALEQGGTNVSDLSFAQALAFLKVQWVEPPAISTAHAKFKAYESRPPTASSARHRAENATRKLDVFVGRIAEFEKQQARAEPEQHTKMVHKANFADVGDPIAVRLAGLDEAVTSPAEGQAALETLHHLQREDYDSEFQQGLKRAMAAVSAEQVVAKYLGEFEATRSFAPVWRPTWSQRRKNITVKIYQLEELAT